MMTPRCCLLLVLILLPPKARAEFNHELFGTYSIFRTRVADNLFTQKPALHSSVNVQLGIVSSLSNNFGIPGEYGFAQSHFKYEDMWLRRSGTWVDDEIDFRLHSLMVGAQQKLYDSLTA